MTPSRALCMPWVCSIKYNWSIFEKRLLSLRSKEYREKSWNIFKINWEARHTTWNSPRDNNLNWFMFIDEFLLNPCFVLLSSCLRIAINVLFYCFSFRWKSSSQFYHVKDEENVILWPWLSIPRVNFMFDLYAGVSSYHFGWTVSKQNVFKRYVMMAGIQLVNWISVWWSFKILLILIEVKELWAFQWFTRELAHIKSYRWK